MPKLQAIETASDPFNMIPVGFLIHIGFSHNVFRDETILELRTGASKRRLVLTASARARTPVICLFGSPDQGDLGGP